ncbi:MAG: methyltransferase domain-containing protein [Clostridiales bacterium]|jgi:trans-aconitate methyltransferase|nr:methyltransferase domain-containing protein [Clostridiales bacterium]
MERQDVPIKQLADDEFNVSAYINSLCRFIRSCETPITISLQGEWGSGKSSFMKLVETKLCGDDVEEHERYSSIWLNTWDLFLENDYDAAVKKLSIELFSQLESHFDNLKEAKEREKMKGEILKFAKAFSNSIINFANLKSELSDQLISKLFDTSENETVAKKKKWFGDFISKAVEEENNGVTNKAFLIFVDDLDRIEPKMAITLLEALKNFFDIKYCVFIIAVDYDVVERGLEQKYGELKITNRNISKDFFDKLVQLPFVIPMNRYNIRDMVYERLKKINFFALDYEYRKYEKTIIDIFTLSTNKNPRSIKRLINMVQLMTIIEQEMSIEYSPEIRMLELLLLAIQLSFPSIYQLLSYNKDFTEWKKNLYATSENTNIPIEIKEKLNLNEEWKEIIYLAATNDTHIRNNYIRVSKLLEIYQEKMNRCEKSNKFIREILGVISIVGVSNQGGLELAFDGNQYDSSSQTQFSQGMKLINSIDFSKHIDVLDVGCGNGKTTIDMWKKNQRMVVDAFDYSQSQIDVAKKNYEEFISSTEPGQPEGGIHFFQLDALELDAENKYDLIFSNAALHWITNAKKMYDILFKALKPGGLLAVHQGGKGSYRGLHAIVKQAISNLGYESYYDNWLFPAFYPEKEDVEQLLEKIGFVNIFVESVESDGREYNKLIENFEKASLIFYKERLKSEEEYDNLVQEYYRLCNCEAVDLYAHRLYIFAEKVG